MAERRNKLGVLRLPSSWLGRRGRNGPGWIPGPWWCRRNAWGHRRPGRPSWCYVSRACRWSPAERKGNTHGIKSAERAGSGEQWREYSPIVRRRVFRLVGKRPPAAYDRCELLPDWSDRETGRHSTRWPKWCWSSDCPPLPLSSSSTFGWSVSSIPYRGRASPTSSPSTASIDWFHFKNRLNLGMELKKKNKPGPRSRRPVVKDFAVCDATEWPPSWWRRWPARKDGGCPIRPLDVPADDKCCF